MYLITQKQERILSHCSLQGSILKIQLACGCHILENNPLSNRPPLKSFIQHVSVSSLDVWQSSSPAAHELSHIRNTVRALYMK